MSTKRTILNGINERIFLLNNPPTHPDTSGHESFQIWIRRVHVGHNLAVDLRNPVTISFNPNDPSVAWEVTPSQLLDDLIALYNPISRTLVRREHIPLIRRLDSLSPPPLHSPTSSNSYNTYWHAVYSEQLKHQYFNNKRFVSRWLSIVSRMHRYFRPLLFIEDLERGVYRSGFKTVIVSEALGRCGVKARLPWSRVDGIKLLFEEVEDGGSGESSLADASVEEEGDIDGNRLDDDSYSYDEDVFENKLEDLYILGIESVSARSFI